MKRAGLIPALLVPGLLAGLFLLPLAGSHAEAPDCMAAAKIISEQGQAGSSDEKKFREATVLCPAMAEAHHNLGVALYREGNFKEAVAELKRAVELKDDESMRLSLALALLGGGNLEAARTELMSLVNRKPENSKASQALAVVYEKEGRPAEAREVLMKALEIQPRDPVILYNMGVMALKSGDREGAADFWKRTVEFEPENQKALENLGFLMFEREAWTEALFYLEKAAAKKGEAGGADAAELNRAIGLIYQRQHDIERSELALRRAVRADEKNFEALVGLSAVLLEKKQEAQALDFVNRALSIKPGDSSGLVLKGRILSALGQLEEAEGALKEVLENDAANTAAMKALAGIYQKSGRQAEAQKLLEVVKQSGGN